MSYSMTLGSKDSLHPLLISVRTKTDTCLNRGPWYLS